MKDRAIAIEQGRAPPSPAESSLRLSNVFVIRLVALSLCGGLISGCALTVPIGPAVSDDLATGSIKPVNASPFSAEMDAEDWRRAKSALDTALDPQGNGASVAWDNPNSGAKGSFVPLSQPYPKDDGICRPFAAHLNLKGEPEHVVHASACRVNSGDWIVGRMTALAQATAKVHDRSDNLADLAPNTHLR